MENQNNETTYIISTSYFKSLMLNKKQNILKHT